MRTALATAFVALVVACGSRQRATWGEVDGAESPAAKAPAPSASAASCEAPAFLRVKIAKGRALPDEKALAASTLSWAQPADGRKLSKDDVVDILRSAAPLDPCDASIPEWQYAPSGEAQIELVDRTTLHLSLFVGQRASLVWPDGTGVLFDYGVAAPWLPKDAQAFAHRDSAHDVDCRTAANHPHRVLFSPPPTFDAKTTLASLRVTCSAIGKDDPPVAWCCP